MVQMKVVKDFEGSRGRVKSGQIINVPSVIAKSWEAQGLAESLYTTKEKTPQESPIKNPESVTGQSEPKRKRPESGE